MATVLEITLDTSFTGLSEIYVSDEGVIVETGDFSTLIVGDQPGTLVDSTFLGVSEIYDPPNIRNVTLISNLEASSSLSNSRDTFLTGVAELSAELVPTSSSTLVEILTAGAEVTGQSDRKISIVSELTALSFVTDTKSDVLVSSLLAESSISVGSLLDQVVIEVLDTSSTDAFSSNVRKVTAVEFLEAQSSLFEGGGSTTNVAIVETLDTASYIIARDTNATAWVLNTESGAVSRFDNFDFNSLATNAGIMFGASAEGLYVIAGDKDEDRDVSTNVTTGFMDLGSDMRKRVSDVYFGYTGGQMKAVVEAYNGPTDNYLFEDTFREGDAPRNNRIKTGRGLTSRYWRISMQNIAGEAFKLQDVTLNVAESKRRL